MFPTKHCFKKYNKDVDPMGHIISSFNNTFYGSWKQWLLIKNNTGKKS